MKSFFSPKLYIEGIKKIKVVGIAFAAISTILSALIPGISMLDWYSTPEEHRYSMTVSAMEFEIPAYFMIMIASIILVLNMFSYLNKRSESDFYHAIPYKRSCVYISFMAAVLSWLVLTALLSTLAAAFFCWIHPGMTVGISIVLTNLGILILLGFSIAATVVVAMTLTGTVISNLLITTLLLCFVPVVGLLFITAVSEIVPLLYVSLTPLRLLQPEFSLPIAILEVMMGYDESILFGNAPMVIYTIIVTVLMLVAGCLLYMFRKSEMASKSAPNKVLQHVYRCAVSLPFALFAAMFIIMEDDFAAFVVIAVITVLVYYAYELITTKRFKNLLKATPFLGVLVAGCLVFVGGVQLTKALTLSYSPDADDIASIGQLEDSNYGYYYDELTYEQLLTQDIEINTPEAFEIVSAALKDSINRTKDGVFYGLYDYEYKTDNYLEYTTVKITDKSGKVCGRQLRISTTDLERLNQLFLESPDYSEALLKMPSDSEVQNVDYFGDGWRAIMTGEDCDKLWDSLVTEYNSLTREQKLAYKSNVGSNYYGEGVVYQTEGVIDKTDEENAIQLPEYSAPVSLEVRGTIGTQTFCSEYSVRSDLFPKTCALYAELLNNCDATAAGYYEDDELYTFGPTNLQEYLPLIESERIDYFSIDFAEFYFGHDPSYKESALSAEKIAKAREIIEYLLNNAESAENADYYVLIRLDMSLDDYSLYHYNETLLGVSAETYTTLYEMMTDPNS